METSCTHAPQLLMHTCMLSLPLIEKPRGKWWFRTLTSSVLVSAHRWYWSIHPAGYRVCGDFTHNGQRRSSGRSRHQIHPYLEVWTSIPKCETNWVKSDVGCCGHCWAASERGFLRAHWLGSSRCSCSTWAASSPGSSDWSNCFKTLTRGCGELIKWGHDGSSIPVAISAAVQIRFAIGCCWRCPGLVIAWNC